MLGVDSVALTNCDDVSLAAQATAGTSTEVPLELSDKLRATAEKKECLDLEVMRTDAGKEVWLRLIAEPIGESGEVAVTLVDITQRKAELMEAIEAGVASKEFDPGRKFDNLFKLKKLLDEGIITEEEYEVERKKLLK